MSAVVVAVATPQWLGPRPFGEAEDPSELGALRRAAFALVEQEGFPTRKHEDWRYTRLAALLAVPFTSPPSDVDAAVVAELVGRSALPEGPRLVFVNGRFAPEHSRPPVTEGLVVKSLAEGLRDDETLRGRLRAGLGTADTFRALNVALADDGALVELSPGTVLREPLHLVFVHSDTDEPAVVSPRNLVLAGADTRASIVESYLGAPGAEYLVNAVTEVVLGEGAVIAHFKLQAESEAAFHLAALDVYQERDSDFSSQLLSLGGAIARHEVQVRLAGEGAHVELNGLFMPHGEQHHDNPTVIAHDAPRCVSREIYKGVVDGHAHGVFNGRVLVALDAAGSDAAQTNKNLLLSELAEVDTRPRLEILADDVKVSHGAAVGQLDEEALFYLRTRGIPEGEARTLLISAFASELVARWQPEAMREHVQALVDGRVPALAGSMR